MNEDLMIEFIKECSKIINEIKRKNNNIINKSLDSFMTNLTSLKEQISSNNTNLINSLLLLSTESFCEAINHIITLKYSKFFYNILILLKKFIEYNLFSKEKSNDIIIIIKQFYNNQKTNEESRKKIMEIIQTYIFSEYFGINYNVLSSLYILILKEFNITNLSRNKDFKNPIRLLFTTLTDKIYKSNNLEIIAKITQFIFSWYSFSIFNNKDNQESLYENINDELKKEVKELFYKNKNNIYIQCLSLELLSQGFVNLNNNNIIIDKGNDELNNFVKEQIINDLLFEVNIIKNNYSLSKDELIFLHYLKICKFLKILFFNYSFNYEIIQPIIEMMNDRQNEKNKIIWKSYLSYGLLSQIISNYELLVKIYLWNKEQLKNIFLSLIIFLNNIHDNILDKNNEEYKRRNIYENKIFLEGDEIIILKEENEKIFINLINESIQNIINSLINNNIKNNENDEIILDMNIFCVICDYLRNLIFNLFSKEINKDNEIYPNFQIFKESNNEFSIYINYIKNLLILYNKIDNFNKKNETLKLLCDLALNFSDKNKKEEKNILIALFLLELAKEIKLLNKDSFVILLQAIEVFNRKYNYLKLNEYIKKDIYKIINDMNNNYINPKIKKKKKKTKIRIEIKIKEEEEDDESNKNGIIEKIEIHKDNVLPDIKKKEENNLYINELCKEINELFLDKNIFDFESVQCIIDALCSCIDLSIQKMKNNYSKYTLTEKNIINYNNINNFNEDNLNTFIFEINFYFSKILSLTLLNLDNIYILFEPFISVVNKLIDNKVMIEFSVDVLCALIPEILLNYKKIKSYINKNINEENKIWINEKWQKVLFSPLLTLLSQPELFVLLKPKIFISIEKIIQKSGNYIDSFGWDSILQICIILSNYNNEDTFIIIKEILNDYNEYLSIFSVIPLMKLLKLFICEEKDKNINFSSIELFWSCANIIDDYLKEKKFINENQKLYFINFIKEKEIKVYCEELYLKLFSYLTEINTSNNIEIKKTALNIFTEIFVSKMNIISKDNCLKIIYEIFFQTFSINSDKYLSDNKNYENEKILEISLLCIIKIIKEYLNQNEIQVDIFEIYLNKIIKIIPFCSNILIIDILKSLVEIKASNNLNTSLVETKIEAYFIILSLIKSYLKNPNFFLDNKFKSIMYRLFSSILSYLNLIPNIQTYSDENIKDIFDIIDSLLNHVCKLESKLLTSKQSKILDFENDLFIFLEKINIKNNVVFKYLFNKMNFDLKNPHSEAICRRSFECFHNLIYKKIIDKKIFVNNDEEKEIICKYITNIKNIMILRNNNEIVELFFNSSIEKNNIKHEINLDKYLENFIKIINEICKNFLKISEDNGYSDEKEKTNIINNMSDILFLILDLFEVMFKQSITGFQSIDKKYYSLINEIYQQIDIISSNFILNKLYYYILLIICNEKNNIYEKIERKLMFLIKLISDISYENIINNGDSSLISLNHFIINELFKICKYKTNEQILNEINHLNININKENYIHKYIKTSKILTNLLIQKAIVNLKKFREEEKKMGDMPLNRGRIYEIISLLTNLKKLEIYPCFNDLNKEEFKVKQNKEVNEYDFISKSKKLHLFYIQPILSDFIYSKENSIKSLIKEIFNEITNIINLPKLIDFCE